MPSTSTRPPPAAVCDGRYRLADRLYGTDELGAWLGEEEDGTPVLVSLGPYVPEAEDELALEVPGVPALLAVDELDRALTALVEQRPRGALADPGAEQAAAVGAEVAAVAGFAHHTGLALGGIRPEAVWREAEVVVTPRLTRLWELARSVPGTFPLPGVYVSLGRLRGGGPMPSDDVFALGATIARWATGAHPFAGDTPAEQVRAIHDGRRRPWHGDPRLGEVVGAALAPREERPGMEQIEAALRELA